MTLSGVRLPNIGRHLPLYSMWNQSPNFPDSEFILSEFELVPEPENTYDRFAVMAMLDGVPIGYLSKSQAAEYQPIIQRLRKSDGPVSVCGWFGRDWKDNRVAVVTIPWPDRLAVWAREDPDERSAIPFGETTEILLAENTEQDTMAGMLGERDRVSAFAMGGSVNGGMIRFVVRGKVIGSVIQEPVIFRDGLLSEIFNGVGAFQVRMERESAGAEIGVTVRITY
jgi:hypothetical protein